MKTQNEIDSKFRFVIVASKRAKQLLKGSKPKLKSKSKNLIRIAQEEVKRGMVDFEIVENPPEELQVSEPDIFIGEELGINVNDLAEEPAAEPKEELKAVEEKPMSPEDSIKDTVKRKVRKKVSIQED